MAVADPGSTVAEHCPGSLLTSWSAGQAIAGAGFDVLTVAVAELLLESLSGVAELMFAVLIIDVLSASEQSTVATRVIVSDAPEASEAKVTVRLLPEPPHTPPPVEEQETKVTDDGRLSVTTTELDVLGPLLRATIV